MTDSSIIFSGPMIRALQKGRKSQTRQVLKPQPGELDVPQMREDGSWHQNASDGTHLSPLDVRWRVGDRLWVREAFSGHYGYAPHTWSATDPIWYWADGNPQHGDWTRPKSSIRMPRRASRLTLTVTDVRVQRLQDISEEDALTEGVDDFAESLDRPGSWEGLSQTDRIAMTQVIYGTAQRAYQHLWEMRYGMKAWSANPWVTATSFTVEHRNIDKTPASFLE